MGRTSTRVFQRRAEGCPYQKLDCGTKASVHFSRPQDIAHRRPNLRTSSVGLRTVGPAKALSSLPKGPGNEAGRTAFGQGGLRPTCYRCNQPTGLVAIASLRVESTLDECSPTRKVSQRLPQTVRDLADKNFQLLKSDPQHPSLHLKQVGDFWSARVGLAHRYPLASRER